MKPKWKWQKLQVLEVSLEAGYKKESVPIDSHVKTANFTALESVLRA